MIDYLLHIKSIEHQERESKIISHSNHQYTRRMIFHRRLPQKNCYCYCRITCSVFPAVVVVAVVTTALLLLMMIEESSAFSPFQINCDGIGRQHRIVPSSSSSSSSYSIAITPTTATFLSRKTTLSDSNRSSADKQSNNEENIPGLPSDFVAKISDDNFVVADNDDDNDDNDDNDDCNCDCNCNYNCNCN